MIIGITGLKRSGKNTIGDYLDTIHGYQQFSFAEKLKRTCCVYLNCAGIPESEREEFKDFLILHKNISKAAGSIGFEAKKYYEFQERFFEVFRPYLIVMEDGYSRYKISYRLILQLFGTEVCRYFDDKVWVKHLCNDIVGLDKVAITDVRFDDEAKALTDMGATILKVERNGCISDGHASEKGVSNHLVNYVVQNTTFEELYRQIEDFIDINKEV